MLKQQRALTYELYAIQSVHLAKNKNCNLAPNLNLYCVGENGAIEGFGQLFIIYFVYF